ncbi:MAG: transglycosylase domain-containing protein, partial [Chloroflexota bacterium]
MAQEQEKPEEKPEDETESAEKPQDRFRRLISENPENGDDNPSLPESSVDPKNEALEDTPFGKGQEATSSMAAEKKIPDDFIEDFPAIDSHAKDEKPFGTDGTAMMAGDVPLDDDETVELVEDDLGSQEETKPNKALREKSAEDIPNDLRVPNDQETVIPPATDSHKTPPPPLGDISDRMPPPVDSQGMPLPRRVTQSDLGGTQPSKAALSSSQSGPARKAPNSSFAGGRGLAPETKTISPWRKRSCFLRLVILGLFASVLLALGLLSVMLTQYYAIAATLPDVDELQGHASIFETTYILDRNGNQLYEILDPNEGRRTYVPLAKISPFMVAATIATEDEAYYSHPGFNWLAILRAFWVNLASGETISGASTITQQLVRAILLDPEEAGQRTYRRKIREAL